MLPSRSLQEKNLIKLLTPEFGHMSTAQDPCFLHPFSVRHGFSVLKSEIWQECFSLVHGIAFLDLVNDLVLVDGVLEHLLQAMLR